jgi:uncharacterized membrane protein
MFLGLLAWTVVMAIVGYLLLIVASSKIEDVVNDSGLTNTATLPAPHMITRA